MDATTELEAILQRLPHLVGLSNASDIVVETCRLARTVAGSAFAFCAYAAPPQPWERGLHCLVVAEDRRPLTAAGRSAAFAIHRRIAAARELVTIARDDANAAIFAGLGTTDPAIAAGSRGLLALPMFHRTGRVVGEIVVGDVDAGAQERVLRALRHLVGSATAVLGNAQRLAAARHDQDRLLLVAETTEEALWDWNLDTGEFWWGGGIQSIVGGSEPIQTSVDWKRDRIHPDDRERVAATFDAAIASPRSSWNEQYRFRRADGTWAFVEDRGHFMREPSGRAYRVFGAVRDVTALHESNERLRKNEERLRAALDASDIGTYVWDLTTDQITPDEAARRLLAGYIDPRDRARVTSERAEAVTRGVPFQQEYRVIGPHGAARWVLDKGRPVRGPDGVATHVPGAVIDITRRKELETEHEEARRNAVEANRAKDEFLAMLGHELRNPLSPMSTALQLLRLRGMDSREVQVLDRQVKHLTRLVDDLLDVSRITRGKIELRRERLDLADVAARALEIVSPLLEQRRHVVQIDVPRGIILDADAARLAQIISNLLTNAAKYSDPGSTIRLEASGGPTACIRVVDEGVGIEPEMLDRVFDVFVQQAQTIDRSQGGLGLGLAIVKSLVELHGGHVRATSAGRGQGSTFIVELPAASAVVAGTRSSADQALAEYARRRKRILVVDDNRDGAEMLRDALEHLGHRVAIAHDGPTALELASTFEPSIALLDIGLPVMDGYEVAARLRGMCGDRRMQLVAVTGYGQEEDRRRSVEAGFDLHLVKPIDLRSLGATIDSLDAVATA